MLTFYRMMECPRCGFAQPEDQFCANCGLDVLHYKAKPKSLLQRLVGSSGLYIGLAVMLVLGLWLILKRGDFGHTNEPALIASQSAPVAKSSKGPVGVSGSASATAPPAAGTTARSTIVASSTPALGTVPTTNDVAGGTPEASDAAAKPLGETTAKPPVEPVAAAAAKPPSQIDVAFYEIARETWQPISGEGKTVSDQNSWRVMIFTPAQKEKLAGALTAARRLAGAKQMSSQPSTAVSLHFPLGTGEAPPGLYLDLSVVKLDGASVELEIAGQVEIKFDETTEIRSHLESTVTLPAGGALVIVESLPRRQLPEALVSAAANSPLNVLQSPDYWEGQSELITLIQGR